MKNQINLTINGLEGKQIISGTIHWLPELVKTEQNYYVNIHVIAVEYSGHIEEDGHLRPISGLISNPRAKFEVSPDGWIGCHEGIIYPSINQIEITNYFVRNHREVSNG